MGDENPRAPSYRLPDFRKREFDGVQQKIENWVNVGVRIGGEELGVHVENAADGGEFEAHRGEASSDGVEGGDGSRTDVRVYVEDFGGVYFEVLEVEEFPAELLTGVCGGGEEGEVALDGGLGIWGFGW